ncbi:phage baseplate assembly protein V [Limnobaculum xujianqingii]|uniref:phage baseplate assembly protein V n=1 Tax=Limnobaculum xujianqingii TaxID=2738837 RepID=UPI001125E523|nr:phage baseplate assembly protein V [Limnobaculum xujianqingii]
MDNFELLRLLCNLIRTGIVTEVNPDKYLARVKTGGNDTDWIRWRADRAGDAVTWWAPSVGEQVILLAPEGELSKAFIIGSLYSNELQPPDFNSGTQVTQHPDGARYEYNPESSSMLISGVKNITITSSDSVTVNTSTATIKASGSITFDTPKVICTNHLSTATLSIEQGGTMTGNINHSGGNFKSNGVVVHSHKHSGVERGGSLTDAPQ